MRVISNKSTSDFQSTFYVQSYDGLDTNGNPKYKTMFRVTGSGRVQAGNEYTDAFMATGDNDLTTKKFVDNKFDFSKYTELS